MLRSNEITHFYLNQSFPLIIYSVKWTQTQYVSPAQQEFYQITLQNGEKISGSGNKQRLYYWMKLFLRRTS